MPAGSLSQEVSHRLQCTARRIWNASIRRQNTIPPTDEHDGNEKMLQYYIRVRLFAYLLLCLAAPGTTAANGDADRITTSYLIRLGLTLSKTCINAAGVESARIALQKVTEHLDASESNNTTITVGQLPTSRHVEYASYYILRIALSWKDDRLDLAEHMYSKATHHIPFAVHDDAAVAATTSLVQLLTQIGHGLIGKSRNYAAALPWFRRAVAESSRLSPDSCRDPTTSAICALQQQHKEPRFAAMRGVLTCLTAMSSFDEARKAVEAAQVECGPRSLDVLAMSATVYMAVGDFVSLGATLTDIVQIWSETKEDNSTALLELVLMGVEKIGQFEGEKAAEVLDNLISYQICRPGSLLDRAVVLRAQLLLQRNDAEVIWDLFELLDCVQLNVDALGVHTAEQLQQIIWKIIQPLYHDKKYTQVLAWCQLGLHAALGSPTPENINRDKFARKMLACHIELTSYAEGLAIFQILPQTARDHIITRFLLFRLAVRGWNQTLAEECIHFFATRTDRDEARDALYACIREAQSLGDKICTAEALESVAVTWQSEACVSATLPSVLRCAIRLQQLIRAEEHGADSARGKENGERIRVAIVHLFQLAAEFVSRSVHDETGAMVFNTAELQWFCTNAYNLGVVNCTSWDPGCVVSLFKSCLVFLNASPVASPEAVTATSTAEVDVVLTSLRCHFVLASLYISEAQTNQSGEHTASLYADAEHHAAAFAAQFQQTITATPAASCCPDLQQKNGILCVFHFEALIFRQAWESLPPVILQAKLCKDGNVFKALGDCLIASEAPPQVKSCLIKRIVNEIFQLEDFNSERLAQYLCCLVRVLLPTAAAAPASSPFNDNLALDILDQAIQVAAEAKEAGVPFPADEAAWLATTTFNHGLTRYAARGSISIGHAWLDRAVAMARFADADGALSAVLQERQRKLADTFAREVVMSTKSPAQELST